MVPFKDYWEKGKPYLDRIIIRQVPDAVSLTINLETGAADCIFQPNFTDVARLQAVGVGTLLTVGLQALRYST